MSNFSQKKPRTNMKRMKKTTTVLATSLALSLTAFAQTSAPLDLSVTFDGFTPKISIVDGQDVVVNIIAFPALNSDIGTFTAISDILTVKVSHDVTSDVIIYSDDEFSDGVNPDNIIGLKRNDTDADTAEVTNPDRVILKVDIANVTVNGSPVGSDVSIPGVVSEFASFVLDKNSDGDTILIEDLADNGQATAEFALGIDASNSVPDSYGRSLLVELVVQ
jgi:hypothetical protein